MWSDWFKAFSAHRVHIHWGVGLLMLQVGKGPVQVLPSQTTWGRDQILEVLGQALGARRGSRNGKWALHVTLGASLCPVSSEPLPSGLDRWDEITALGQARLAQLWPGQELVVAQDIAHPQVAVGLAQDWLQALRNWAASHNATVASVRPLWSLASECQQARHRDIKAMVVQEPDALSFLHQTETGLEVQILPITAGADQTEMADASVRRWCLAQGLDSAQVLRLQFGPPGNKSLTDGPVVWPTCWSAA